MIEYRIKPVTRYLVTRYEQGRTSGDCCSAGSVSSRGEFDNAETAYSVGYALCKMEHEISGEPVGSMEFIYPEHPDHINAVPA